MSVRTGRIDRAGGRPTRGDQHGRRLHRVPPRDCGWALASLRGKQRKARNDACAAVPPEDVDQDAMPTASRGVAPASAKALTDVVTVAPLRVQAMSLVAHRQLRLADHSARSCHLGRLGIANVKVETSIFGLFQDVNQLRRADRENLLLQQESLSRAPSANRRASGKACSTSDCLTVGPSFG